jgi:acylphosphatase
MELTLLPNPASGFILAVLRHAPSTATRPERRRMTVLYSGRVQGVGFRYTTKTVSTGFEVTGIVRNLPDGRVELLVEGTLAELEAFRLAIRDSGLGGLIHEEKVALAEPVGEFKGFEIVR